MMRRVNPRVHLVNPSHVSFGVAVITPRWLYVLAAATGTAWGDPHIVDETLDPVDPEAIGPGDVVGIGDPEAPDWVSFESIVDGRAMVLNYSGVRFRRMFTP